jgi:hypothetical protein
LQLTRKCPHASLSVCEGAIQGLDVKEQLDILSKLFTKTCDLNVPADFLLLAASGMQNLCNAGRSNVIYVLAKAVGKMRTDDSDTLLYTIEANAHGLFFHSIFSPEDHLPSGL